MFSSQWWQSWRSGKTPWLNRISLKNLRTASKGIFIGHALTPLSSEQQHTPRAPPEPAEFRTGISESAIWVVLSVVRMVPVHRIWGSTYGPICNSFAILLLFHCLIKRHRRWIPSRSLSLSQLERPAVVSENAKQISEGLADRWKIVSNWGVCLKFLLLWAHVWRQIHWPHSAGAVSDISHICVPE